MKTLIRSLLVLLLACPLLTLAAEPETPFMKDVSVEEAAALLEKNREVTVLDVRTQEEYRDGHVEGAVLVDYTGGDFETEAAKLDRDRPYLVHCASGRRSSEAVKELKELGFQRIYHLKDGFNGWKKAGKPVSE